MLVGPEGVWVPGLVSIGILAYRQWEMEAERSEIGNRTF